MENERHAVTGRDLFQSSGGGGPTKLGRAADGLVESVHQASLFIGQSGRITDDVDKENVCDLEALVRFRFLWHKLRTLGCDAERLKPFRSCDVVGRNDDPQTEIKTKTFF